MAKFGFDIAEVEVSERGDFEVMPKGEYRLKGVEAESKTTSRGDGSYIAAKFEVIKPSEYSGRFVWQNFNVENPNDKAQKIGREQLAGWARACGKPNAKDTDELLERPFDCKLDIEKGTGGYSDKNKIASFLSASSGSGNVQNASTPPAKETSTPEEKPAKKEPAPASPSSGSAKKNPWD